MFKCDGRIGGDEDDDEQGEHGGPSRERRWLRSLFAGGARSASPVKDGRGL
jgi:hypothetical protein